MISLQCVALIHDTDVSHMTTKLIQRRRQERIILGGNRSPKSALHECVLIFPWPQVHVESSGLRKSDIIYSTSGVRASVDFGLFLTFDPDV